MTIPQEFAQKVKRANSMDKIMRVAPMIILVVMILVFSVLCGFDVFLAPSNIVAILKQLAIPLCVALGLTFVIMIGSIDLSINGVVGMAGSLAGVLVANEVFNFNLGILGVALAILAAVAVGFLIGVGFLLLLDMITPHMHMDRQNEGPRSGFKRTTKLILAVTLHNIPEGMAVGVVYAGFLAGDTGITAAGALALALGIAIQNFPEGAIVAMPLLADGMPKAKTFWMGVLSGAVEPVAAIITILAAGLVTPVMPYFLAFAAGAMMYVVVEELIPEMSEGPHSNIGTIAFSLGFVTMMILDVTLG